MLDAAAADDRLATEVVGEIGRRLTLVVATLVTLLDPALVILSGHVARSCERPRRAVEAGLPQYLPPPFPAVGLSPLVDGAVTTGALDRAMAHTKQTALSVSLSRVAHRSGC